MASVALGPRLIARAIDIAREHNDFFLVGGEEGVVDKRACHEVAKGAPAAAGLDAIVAVELHLTPYERSEVFPILLAALDAGVAVVGAGGYVALHDGVETVEDVLLVEHILIGIGEDIYQHPNAEVFGFLAHPGKVDVLLGQGELVGEGQSKAEFVADKFIEFVVVHALKGLGNAAVFVLVDMVEDALFVLEQHLVQCGTVFDSKIEDGLWSGILVNVHIDFVGIVGTDVEDENVAVILEHLGVFVGRKGDVDYVEQFLRHKKTLLWPAKERVDKVFGLASVNILAGNNHQLQGLA